MSYSDDNIFAKILRKEIPCEKVYEDDHCLAFKDINPQAKIHILVVPKGKYISFDDFSQNASGEEISSFFKAVGKIAKDLDLSTEGYRILSNIGKLGGQEVPHFHIHIFGKQDLGPMLSENLG
ncbi:MAG: histidine triad nucleotide-binding protein [Rickettsiales bacterium]|nr:histidine triad nucleotide-binding protein [Rickettsiales bacterium]